MGRAPVRCEVMYCMYTSMLSGARKGLHINRKGPGSRVMADQEDSKGPALAVSVK